MPIFGPANYIPSGQFAFPRPYVEQITFGFGAGAIIAQSDNEFFITDGGNPNVHVVCNLLPEFWASNSNRYTLDFLIVDWWLLIDPDPLPQFLPFNVLYRYDVVNQVPDVYIHLGDATTQYRFNTPPPPPGYWTPV